MLTEKDDIELLERAWSNQLRPEEAEALNERLLIDDTFAALHDELFALWDGLAQAGKEAETRTLFKQWDKENPIAGPIIDPAPVKRILMPLSIALSALAIVGAACVYFFVPQQLTDEQLFKKYFDGGLSKTDRIGGEPSHALTPQLEEAYTLFAQARYFECEKNFHAFLTSGLGTSFDQDEARFFRGMSLIHLKRFDESASELDILSAGKGLFMPDATWYAALSHLRIGERAQAKSLLEKVCFEGGAQKDEAIELLKKL